MTDKPLFGASERLRENPRPGWPRKPGRPRARPERAVAATNGALATASAGTGRAQEPARARVNGGLGEGARATQAPALLPVAPRLLDLASAAIYLAMAPWTVRELEWRGVLPRVRVPLPDGGELRKLLFDRVDLDALITRWKDPASPGGRALRGTEQASAANGGGTR